MEDKTNHLGGTTLSSGQRTQVQTQMHNCYENDLVKDRKLKVSDFQMRNLNSLGMFLNVGSQVEDPLIFKTCGPS